MIDGSLSAVELLESCLGRIDEVDGQLNAMVIRADERARSEAAAVDGALAATTDVGEREALFAERPLLGLPIGIKDLQATEGIRTTFGSEQFADNVPNTDAGIVANVRAAGAIVVGKTNIPERSIGANTVNRLFGATGNPFDPTKTCGGSSGGSAVALAAEMVPLATGSDHGGSLRIPACFCGVVGHRATPGIVPFEERTTPQTFYSVQGPMARTVADTALLLSVVSSRRRRAGGRLDPMAFPFPTETLARLDALNPTELRIGVSEDLGGVLVSQSIRGEFGRRVDALADQGVRMVPVPVDLASAAEVDWKVRADIFVTQYHAEASTWDEGFNPNIRSSYDSALTTPMAEIAIARSQQMDLIQKFQSLFVDYELDAICCPGVSVSPFPWAELYPQEVDGQPVENYMAWLALTAAITVVGHPVTALPAGLDAFGMPFGIQLVGPMYEDRRLLSVAQTIETCWSTSPFARPRPSVRER